MSTAGCSRLQQARQPSSSYLDAERGRPVDGGHELAEVLRQPAHVSDARAVECVQVLGARLELGDPSHERLLRAQVWKQDRQRQQHDTRAAT